MPCCQFGIRLISLLRLGRPCLYSTISGLPRPRFDFKSIVRNKERIRLNAIQRKVSVDVDGIVALYQRRKELDSQLNQLQRLRNAASAIVRTPDMPNEEDDFAEQRKLRKEVSLLEDELHAVENDLLEKAMRLPNDTSNYTPIGDASSNIVLEEFGTAHPQSMQPSRIVDHVDMGKKLDILDFEAGARVAGSQFYFLKNEAALLELALVNYAMKKSIDRGFTPIIPPEVAYLDLVSACGFAPREREDLPVYKVGGSESGSNYHPQKALIGTSEIPLAGYNAGKVMKLEELPIRYVAVSRCFRTETGHHGAESRGLYRVHQFTKVELFALCLPEFAEKVFDQLVAFQKDILGGLGLRCRALEMSSEELGAAAYRKIDIETWFPRRNSWGELSSASNCTDYQSKRLSIRYRDPEAGEARFVATLNATACAVPRVMQAILENFQRDANTIEIPAALRPFMLNGAEYITIRKPR